jgi:hypothetical protein
VPIASARRCLAALAVAAAVLPVTACTGDRDDVASARAAASTTARDPLVALPAHFTVPRPDSATAIRFYVSCSPDSRFRVSIGTWFAGPCSTAFQNSGQLPLGPIGQPVTVDLDLPTDVHYWLVGLAVS